MALPKLFQRIFWHNNASPALNESNLNAMSKGIDDIDNRVVELAGDILETVPLLQTMMENIETLSENPPYIGANGNWYVWDTNTGAYVDSGVDASITVNIADVTAIAPDATPYVTNTGTNTDPVFHLFIPRGTKGDTGTTPNITIIASTDGTSSATPTVQVTKTGTAENPSYAIAFSGLKGAKGDTGNTGATPNITASATVDANVGTPSVQVTQGGTAENPTIAFAFSNLKGADGTGSGDMLKSVYDTDNDGKVDSAENADTVGGHIVGKDVPSDAVFTDTTYSAGAGISVSASNEISNAGVRSVSAPFQGTASNSSYRCQTISQNTGGSTSYSDITVSRYMEISNTSATTYAFNNSIISASSAIEVYTDTYGDNPSDVTINGNICTVTFSESKTRTVRIYIK